MLEILGFMLLKLDQDLLLEDLKRHLFFSLNITFDGKVTSWLDVCFREIFIAQQKLLHGLPQDLTLMDCIIISKYYIISKNFCVFFLFLLIVFKYFYVHCFILFSFSIKRFSFFFIILIMHLNDQRDFLILHLAFMINLPYPIKNIRILKN